jgi:glutathione S-transferase
VTRAGEKPFFGGDQFTILDAYAFWAIRNYGLLTKRAVPARLSAFLDRVRARPAVQAAFAAEGIR